MDQETVEHLKQHPLVRTSLDLWWNSALLQLDDDGDGTIDRDEYVHLYKRLLFGIARLYDTDALLELHVETHVQTDWDRDSEGARSIDHDRFCTSILELSVAWCTGESEEEHAKFLTDLHTLVFVTYTSEFAVAVAAETSETKVAAIDISSKKSKKKNKKKTRGKKKPVIVQKPSLGSIVTFTEEEPFLPEEPAAPPKITMLPEKIALKLPKMSSAIQPREITHVPSRHFSIEPQTVVQEDMTEINAIQHRLVNAQRQIIPLALRAEVTWLKCSSSTYSKEGTEAITRGCQSLVAQMTIALQEASSPDCLASTLEPLVEKVEFGLEQLSKLIHTWQTRSTRTQQPVELHPEKLPTTPTRKTHDPLLESILGQQPSFPLLSTAASKTTKKVTVDLPAMAIYESRLHRYSSSNK